jgi:hypothetical protein
LLAILRLENPLITLVIPFVSLSGKIKFFTTPFGRLRVRE